MTSKVIHGALVSSLFAFSFILEAAVKDPSRPSLRSCRATAGKRPPIILSSPSGRIEGQGERAFCSVRGEEPLKVASRAVVISSGITRKSQGYKKWGTHYPTSFKVSINDQMLESGRQKKFSVSENKIRVKYEYSFLKGKIKGAKEITFALDPRQSQHTLTFSWDDPWRVRVSSANPISTKELYKKWM
jgi:hypothetical protein